MPHFPPLRGQPWQQRTCRYALATHHPQRAQHDVHRQKTSAGGHNLLGSRAGAGASKRDNSPLLLFYCGMTAGQASHAVKPFVRSGWLHVHRTACCGFENWPILAKKARH